MMPGAKAKHVSKTESERETNINEKMCQGRTTPNTNEVTCGGRTTPNTFIPCDDNWW